jgi:hypothetical protein
MTAPEHEAPQIILRPFQLAAVPRRSSRRWPIAIVCNSFHQRKFYE